jgi:hypothetical protein
MALITCGGCLDAVFESSTVACPVCGRCPHCGSPRVGKADLADQSTCRSCGGPICASCGRCKGCGNLRVFDVGRCNCQHPTSDTIKAVEQSFGLEPDR